MNLDRIRDIIVNFVQRDWESEQFTSELHFAQMKYFDIMLSAGKDLQQFIVKMGEGNPPMMVSSGWANLPTDYFRFISATVQTGSNYVRVRPCDVEQFDYLRQSPIEYPTSDYPILRIIDDRVQFLPADVLYVNFIYYRVPTAPVWGDTISGGVSVYDAATSTELDWDEDDQIGIIQILLQDLGVIVSQDQIRQQQNERK